MGKGRPRAVEKGVAGQSLSVSSSGSVSIPSGPVYFPTEDEFRDPLDYIYKIRPEAEPYGICKIVPPKSWKPPFALDLDFFTFPTKTQEIHKLQARPAACDSKTFELEYSRFLEDQCGKKSRKKIVFEGEELDLCKLFNAVKRYGGYDKVVREKKWGDVSRFVGPSRKITDCAKHVLSQLYSEHLYDYENFYSRLNQQTGKKGMLEDEQSDHGIRSSGSKRIRRSVDCLKVKDCKVQEEEHDQICEQCRSGLHGDVMLLCDRCDKGWHIYCLSPPLKQIPPGNWYCFNCLNSDRDSFGFVPGKQYTLEAFRRVADRSRRRWFGPGPVSRVQIEKKFWEIVEGLVGEVEVMYGSDLDTSVFGSGFPRSTDQKPEPIDSKLWDEYSSNPWNLNNLPKLKGSMLRAVHHNITGVMVPWLYIGMLFSSFCWHFEDHCFYSINYLHWGEPKCWYSVPGSEAGAFEKVMRSSLPDLFDAQPDLLFQLVTMLNPSVLQKNGVPVYSIIQEPGNFVITFPRSYHGGFNLGLNCAEAVNFAPADWLPYGAFGADLYQRYHKAAVLSHEELLCVVAQYSDIDTRASPYLKKELLRIYDKEKSWREKLWKNGIVKSSCMACRQYPQYVGTEEDPSCIICQQCLYLSAVVCSCRPSSFVCLEHWEHLCECKTVKLRLLYRHSLAELHDLALSVDNYTSDDKALFRNIRKHSSCPGTLTKKLATQWLLRSSEILQNPYSSDAVVSVLREAEQFLWAGPEMNSVRDMVKSLIEAQKWAEGIRDCLRKIEAWLCDQDFDREKVHLEFVDQLLTFNFAPCNEPAYHKLKEYTEGAVLLSQEINIALSKCSKMSELESLHSRVCGYPLYVKDVEKLERKISSTKVWLQRARSCISIKHPAAVELDVLYKLKSEIMELQVLLPEMDVIQNILSQAESCGSKCSEMLEGPMNLKNVKMLLKEWDGFMVDVPEVKLLRKYYKDAVSWVSNFNHIVETTHEREDQHNVIDELKSILGDGLSLKIHVDELPLVETELQKALCREKALQAYKSRLSLEFVQEVMKEARLLQLEGEKLFVGLSGLLAVAIPWEERAKEILSHKASFSDFRDIIRASESIFMILPSLDDMKAALLEANSWLMNSKQFLVSSTCPSDSPLKVEELQMLVSQSKLLKISFEEVRMLEIVLQNCKKWECEACSLLEDAQHTFELDDVVHGISSGLMSKVEGLIARMQSSTKSGLSLGFDFDELPKLKATCSTLRWCKKILSFCNLSPSLEDVLEATKDFPHLCDSGALLNILIRGVKWLRQALEVISGSHNSRRSKSGEVDNIIRDYQTINIPFAAIVYQLEEAIGKHKMWQEQAHQFLSLCSGKRSWVSMLKLKELGDKVAFTCRELDLISSEVEKVENWKKHCMNFVGTLVQNENSLLDVLQKMKQSLDRSLFIYGKLKDCKDECLCIYCFTDFEDQEYLTCSTCGNCYHTLCIRPLVDNSHEDYTCSSCKILKGESNYKKGTLPVGFGVKRAELKVLLELLSDAKNLCVRIDETDALNQLVEQALLCRSCLRDIVNFTSADVDNDLSTISEKLTIAIKACEVAGVSDQQDLHNFELALARHLWKIRVNRMLNSLQNPSIQEIQKHLKEGLAMEISPEDRYMLQLSKVNCLYLQWAELTKKVAVDSGAFSLDKVFKLIAEGEKLPVNVDEDLRILMARSMLYCICRKPFDPGRMIACNQCGEWYHFDCMKLPYSEEFYTCPACNPSTAGMATSLDHERLTSGKLEEPKTPSPRHTNPRKKQKMDEASVSHKMCGSEDHIEDNDCSYSRGIECLRWQNRKPFRRAAKKRVDFRRHSSFLCIHSNN
ncbi:lysine-specific demethylase JMJ17-like isoform X2 [Prosopis cineraria]|uniref:lysine-specific demethylase JMJ17-like isoform X2 n=1 Tax=Prosopis cineraria TaxID=364024 RepID=UPI00240F7954|nr:lysine-specific demethylase JMJ17-like isoform X2 [Prosopis cineraria]